MVRAAIGVIIGYLAMAIFVFATFSMAYLILGAEGSFKPGTYEPSMFWIVMSFALSLIAAIVGGFVCATIARGGRTPLVLAALVLVLGMLFAIPVLRARRDAGGMMRAGGVSNMEAMQKAKQPVWVALLTPLVGAAGVFIGARMGRTS